MGLRDRGAVSAGLRRSAQRGPALPRGYVQSMWGEVCMAFLASIFLTPIIGFFICLGFYSRAKRIERETGYFPHGAWVFALVIILNIVAALAVVWIVGMGFATSEKKERVRESRGVHSSESAPTPERPRDPSSTGTPSADTANPPDDPFKSEGDETEAAKRRREGGK